MKSTKHHNYEFRYCLNIVRKCYTIISPTPQPGVLLFYSDIQAYLPIGLSNKIHKLNFVV